MGESQSHRADRYDPDPIAFDPVLEALKRDIDFSLVERNLRLTIEERAQQLVQAARFLEKFRPLVTNAPRSRYD